MQSYEIDWRAI